MTAGPPRACSICRSWHGKVALRLVASQEDFGGWTDNTATGVKDENERRIDTYRGKLRLAPNDKLDVVLSFWRTDSKRRAFHRRLRRSHDGSQRRSATTCHTTCIA